MSPLSPLTASSVVGLSLVGGVVGGSTTTVPFPSTVVVLGEIAPGAGAVGRGAATPGEGGRRFPSSGGRKGENPDGMFEVEGVDVEGEGDVAGGLIDVGGDCDDREGSLVGEAGENAKAKAKHKKGANKKT